jgi:hypothetical protein
MDCGDFAEVEACGSESPESGAGDTEILFGEISIESIGCYYD